MNKKYIIIVFSILALVLCSGSLYFSLANTNTLQIGQAIITHPGHTPGYQHYAWAVTDQKYLDLWNSLDPDQPEGYVEFNDAQDRQAAIRLDWAEPVKIIDFDGRYVLVLTADWGNRWVESQYLRNGYPVNQTYIISHPRSDVKYARPPATLKLNDLRIWNNRFAIIVHKDQESNDAYIELNRQQVSGQAIRLQWGCEVTLIKQEDNYSLVQIENEQRWVHTIFLKHSAFIGSGS